MATTIESLVVRLTGDGIAYLNMLKTAETATKNFTDSATASLEGLIDGFKALSKAFVVPAIAGGAFSLNEFSKFNLAMTEATSIMVGLTDEQKVAMESMAKELSMKGKQSAEELAKAYYHLASAGLSARDAMGALPVIQNFATAGAFDLAKATDLAMTAQGALALRSQDAAQNVGNLARITNVLVRANTLATGSAEQFAIALTTGSAVAGRGFGQDVEEIVGSLIVLHKQGIKAQEAGNMLARMWRILSQTAVMHADAYKKLGVAVFDPKTHNMRHASDIVDDLTKAFSKMSDEQRTATMKSLGWEAKLQGALKPFLGMSKVMKESVDELRKASGGQGESARVAEKQMEAFTNQMKMTWNMTKVLAIEIGEMLAPAVTALVLPLKEAIKWLRELSKPAQELLLVAVAMSVAMTGFFAVVIGGFVLLNVVMGGAPILMGVILTAILAASVGATVFVAKLGGIGNTLTYLKQKGEEAWKWLNPVRIALLDLFRTAWFAAHQAFDAIGQYVNDTWLSISKGATINWEKVRVAIVGAIIAGEFAMLRLGDVSKTAWAGIKYGAVAALNFLLNHAIEIVVRFVTLAPTIVAVAAKATFDYLVEEAKIAWKDIKDIISGDPVAAEERKKRPDTRIDLSKIRLTLKGVWSEALDKLEAELKEEFEKLGAEAAKSFNKFYEEKMAELTKLSFDDFYKKTFKDLYAKIGEGAEKVGMMMLGLNPQGVEKQGEDMGNAFNAGVNKTLGKFDAAIYRSAEAFSRIEAYRAQMADDINMSGPRHGGGGGAGTGLGHPHQKAVDVFAGQGGGGVGNVVARAEDTVPILKDIRAILAGADKKPGIKVEAAELA